MCSQSQQSPQNDPALLDLFSKKQIISYQQSHGKINIWEGSVRSGKTYISLWRFLVHVSKGPLGDYVIIARTRDLFKRNVLPQISQMIGTSARYYSGKSELHIYGKTVHIVGADDERAEAKIRGPTFLGAYVDEITIIPESVWQMLISRCAMGDSKIFGTTNPDSPFHWLKVNFLSGTNPDVRSWAFRLDDNPRLLQSEKDYLKRQYKGLWYQRFIEGLWVQAEGSIYDFFEEQYHVIDFPLSEATYYIVGCDYGTTNPCAFVLLGINFTRYPNIWVEDEYYWDSKRHQRQKTDAEYAEDLMKFIQYRNIQAIYVDPSAVSFKTELRYRGVDNIYDAQNEVVDGIRFVGKYLNAGTLKIVRKCQNLIREFQSYVWDSKSYKTGIDRPLKENDHALDALRYAVFSHFFASDGKHQSAKEIDDHYRDTRNSGPNLPPFFQDDQGSSRPFPGGF